MGLLGEQCCRERAVTFKLNITNRKLIKIKKARIKGITKKMLCTVLRNDDMSMYSSCPLSFFSWK